MNTITLENDVLRLTFAPEFGGKIVSILELANNVEYLLPAAQGYGAQGPDNNFADSDRGGFDECLPSVSKCEGTAVSPPVPDHGELWHMPWTIVENSPRVILAAQCGLSGLFMERSVSLTDRKIHMHYQLQNRSAIERHWLWSSHPLLRVEPGDRILLPDEVHEVAVEFSTSQQIKQRGTVGWPAPSGFKSSPALNVVGPADDTTAHKLFASLNESGWCALQKSSHDRALMFRFDPQAIPYIGIWICLDAWPEGREPKQYTVALEPCTANCDSLEKAIKSGTARVLSPGETTSWDVELEVVTGASRTGQQ